MKSYVIISGSISLRNLYNSLKSIKEKGFLTQIMVFKGFSANLKVLKDFNQYKSFKGSSRGPGTVLPNIQDSIQAINCLRKID